MKQYRQTSLIYRALFVGQLLFALVVFWMVTSKAAALAENYRSYTFDRLPMMVALIGIAGAMLMNKLRSSQGAAIEDVPQILQHYHTTVMLRSAILEGCNLIVLTLALINGNLFFMLYFGIGMAAFLYFRPTVENLAKDYGLTPQQEAALKQKVNQ